MEDEPNKQEPYEVKDSSEESKSQTGARDTVNKLTGFMSKELFIYAVLVGAFTILFSWVAHWLARGILADFLAGFLAALCAWLLIRWFNLDRPE